MRLGSHQPVKMVLVLGVGRWLPAELLPGVRMDLGVDLFEDLLVNLLPRQQAESFHGLACPPARGLALLGGIQVIATYGLLAFRFSGTHLLEGITEVEPAGSCHHVRHAAPAFGS